jgi:hypothetical protein
MHHVGDVKPKEHGVSKYYDEEILASTKLATSFARICLKPKKI